MRPEPPRLSRRTLLGAAALLPIAACAENATPRSGQSSAPPSTGATSASAVAPAAPAAAGRRHEKLAALERRYEAALGVYAVNTGTNAVVEHRADERFAFCSTFKGLATAAVLYRHPMSYLETRVAVTAAEVERNWRSSIVTRNHVGSQLALREVCEAAIISSDGTAGNLLLRHLGGPGQLTAFLRGLDDTVTQAVRTEPELTQATPGDKRDTTSPRAIGEDYRKLVLGAVLPPEKRRFLRDLLRRADRLASNRNRIRAGVPRGWKVGGKTGTGSYGTTNDIAIVWPPTGAPLLVAVMSRKSTNVAGDDALLAEAARYVTATLTG